MAIAPMMNTFSVICKLVDRCLSVKFSFVSIGFEFLIDTQRTLFFKVIVEKNL
jgi:hypothetical protein